MWGLFGYHQGGPDTTHHSHLQNSHATTMARGLRADMQVGRGHFSPAQLARIFPVLIHPLFFHSFFSICGQDSEFYEPNLSDTNRATSSLHLWFVAPQTYVSQKLLFWMSFQKRSACQFCSAKKDIPYGYSLRKNDWITKDVTSWRLDLKCNMFQKHHRGEVKVQVQCCDEKVWKDFCYFVFNLEMKKNQKQWQTQALSRPGMDSFKSSWNLKATVSHLFWFCCCHRHLK